MPHIRFKKNNLIKTPVNKNGVFFNFCVKAYSFEKNNHNSEYKIAVTNENRDFLLTLKEKNDSLLIKPDNITRVTPVEIINNH